MEYVDRELATPRFVVETSPTYLGIVRKFIFDNVANKMAEIRRGRGMFDALEREDEWDEDTDLSMGASGVYKSVIIQKHSFIYAIFQRRTRLP